MGTGAPKRGKGQLSPHIAHISKVRPDHGRSRAGRLRRSLALSMRSLKREPA